MSQMNPKEVFHNIAYSVHLPYIAGHFFVVTNQIVLLLIFQVIYLVKCVCFHCTVGCFSCSLEYLKQ